MKLACCCGEILTHELTLEHDFFAVAHDRKPMYNIGQYAWEFNWIAKVLKRTINPDEKDWLEEGAFFRVPERIPRPFVHSGFDEEPVTFEAAKEDLTIETLRFDEQGQLTVLRNLTLPPGVAMSKRTVLESVIPPWPVHEYQAKWREAHPGQPFGAAPEWPEGSPFGGCCNWGNLEVACPCGALLGLLEIDCYQQHIVTFYERTTMMVQ